MATTTCTAAGSATSGPSWAIPASAASDHPTASRPVSSGCAHHPGTSSVSTPAWDTDVTSAGQVGVLQDPQDSYVAAVAGESSRQLVLFSHHQLVSYYDKADLGSTLPAKLAPVLNANRVTAWWWGHEHRAITYEAGGGIRYPRCLGNGGVPVLPDPAPQPAASPPSSGTARARSGKTARTGPGSVSRCSTCTRTVSRPPTWTTTGTSRTPRRSPEAANAIKSITFAVSVVRYRPASWRMGSKPHRVGAGNRATRT